MKWKTERYLTLTSSYLCYDWHTDKYYDALRRYFLSPAELRYKPLHLFHTLPQWLTLPEISSDTCQNVLQCVMNHISEQSCSLLVHHFFFHLLWSMSWISPTKPPSLPPGKEVDGLDLPSQGHTHRTQVNIHETLANKLNDGTHSETPWHWQRAQPWKKKKHDRNHMITAQFSHIAIANHSPNTHIRWYFLV